MEPIALSLCLVAAASPGDAGPDRALLPDPPISADTVAVDSAAVRDHFPVAASWVLEGSTSGGEQAALHVLSVALERELGAGMAARVEFLGKWGREGVDAFPSSQGLSSLDADDFRSLGEAWLEWSGAGWARVKAGWVDANTEFAASEGASAFVNPSFGLTPTLAYIPSYPAPRPSVNAFVAAPGGTELGVGAYWGTEGDWSVVAQAASTVRNVPSLRWRMGVAGWRRIMEDDVGGTEPSIYLIVDWSPTPATAGFVKLARAGPMRHVAAGLTSRIPARPELTTGVAASMVSDSPGDELVAEAYVAVRVARWLVVQPDVQVRLARGQAPAAAGLVRVVVER